MSRALNTNNSFPLVTIAIPAYNVAPYIEKSLESAFSQNYPNIEFLIIPDKCTDNTLDVIQKSVSKYNWLNIRILPPPAEQRGISFNRNLMLKLAKGDYIIFLDSDDFLEENAVTILVKAIRKNNSDLVIANYIKQTLNGEVLKRSNYKPLLINSTNNIIDRCFNSDSTYNYHFACWAKIYSLKFLHDANVFFDNDIILDDWIFSYLIFIRANRMSIIQECVYSYTAMRPGSLVNSKEINNSPKIQNSWLSLSRYYSQWFNDAIESNIQSVIPFLASRLLLINSHIVSKPYPLSMDKLVKALMYSPINRTNISNLFRLLWQQRKAFFL